MVQEIKRMVVVYFMHGLFLTCTQNLLIFTNHSLKYLQDVQHFHPTRPLALLKKQPHFTYLKSQLLCSWWRIPIPYLWSANNCPTPWLLPVSPFHTPQFKIHYLHRRHQQSRSSLSGTERGLLVAEKHFFKSILAFQHCWKDFNFNNKLADHF